jgi:L-methionine (R)-S-oxide reductase
MIKLNGIEKMSDEQRLRYMLMLLDGQLSSEDDFLANICNASAIIKALIEKLNWVGFYFIKGDELVLGPFQGLPACNRVAKGKGVCGKAVESRMVQRIENVHEFEGHIACDTNSSSELVIPIIKNSEIIGVLDIDSPEIGRFTILEEKYFVMFVNKLVEKIDWV